MKKILLSIFAILLLVSGTAEAQYTRSQATNRLVSLGMHDQLAKEVAGLASGLGVIPNNTYLRVRNAAGTANLSVLKSDASDNTVLNAGTGKTVSLAVNSVNELTAASTGVTVAAGDVNMNTSGQTLAIQEATAANACSGSVTANGTTPVATSTTCWTTGSRVFLTKTSTSAVNGSCYISATSNGVSFTITCLATDTGTYNWFIIHEAP